MEEIYQKISDLNPIRLSHNEDIRSFDVTELWRHDSTGVLRAVLRKTVEIGDVTRWLEEGAEDESLVLRLVWLNVEFEKLRVGVPKSVEDKLVTEFGLKLAYGYLQSTITGVNAFPKTRSSGSEQEAFAFNYAPKLTATWSHTRFETRPPVTYGIISASDDYKIILQRLLGSQWQPSLPGHPMFLPFLFSLMFDLDCCKIVHKMKKRVQESEMKTWTNRSGDQHAAMGELEDLFIDMGNAASKLASVGRKSTSLEGLLDFIIQHVSESGQGNLPAGHQISDGNDLMRYNANVLRERHGMQVLDTNFTLKRVQVQMSASDSMNNFNIALSSHRDASSMKTLAVVTMFFLPGSFISALFSTNCFDWDGVDLGSKSMGVKTTPQFDLYWVVTIPLTVITFVLYYCWLVFQGWQRRKLLDNMQERLGRGAGESSTGDQAFAYKQRAHTMSITSRISPSKKKKGKNKDENIELNGM